MVEGTRLEIVHPPKGGSWVRIPPSPIFIMTENILFSILSVIMKYNESYQRIIDYSGRLNGVFSLSDIKNLLRENNSIVLYRHLKNLEEQKILTRFTRGFYVAPNYSLEVLSQRVCPKSYISCGNVLAKNLVIGSVPAKTVYAVKVGKNRIYKSQVGTLVYFQVSPQLFCGFETTEGVSVADKEKAFLDTLYFFQKGTRFSFSIPQDLNVKALDRKKIEQYLKLYKNPKFVQFVKGIVYGRN